MATRALRATLVCVLAAGAALPGAAGAQATPEPATPPPATPGPGGVVAPPPAREPVAPISPSIGARAPWGTDLVFRVSGRGVSAERRGDLHLLLSSDPATMPSGLLRRPLASVTMDWDGADGWTLTADARNGLARTAGTYYWQVVESGTGVEPALTGPVFTFTVGDRPAGRAWTAPLGARYGSRTPWVYRINATDLRPRGVTASRFRTLATRSGTRWRLRAAGTTRAKAGVRDGVSTVGWSRGLPDQVLGVETAFYVQEIRTSRTCVGGRCTYRRVPGRQRVVERDIAINARANWQPGPHYPAADQFDLETTILHEFGHMAGNGSHPPSCSDTPMNATASPGSWWRAPSDRNLRGCRPPLSEQSPARLLEQVTAPADGHHLTRMIRVGVVHID